MPWAKRRNEELVPILLLANRKNLDDGDEFKLMCEGHRIDVKLYTGSQTTQYQITLAYPQWDNATQRTIGGGYQDHLRNELLRCAQPAFGGNNIRKENGAIVSKPHARDIRDDVDAWRHGWIDAIKRKQAHDGAGATLLIYARLIGFDLIDVDLSEVVSRAVSNAGANRFERVCVLDQNFCWEA